MGCTSSVPGVPHSANKFTPTPKEEDMTLVANIPSASRDEAKKEHLKEPFNPADHTHVSNLSSQKDDIGDPNAAMVGEVLEDFTTSKWKKVKTLGSGAFGTVYLAMNDSGESVAVKTITFNPEDPNVHTSLTLLKREMKSLRMVEHKNIVRYFKSTRTGNSVHMFMEYCSGGSMRALYNRIGPMDAVRLKKYTTNILDGLIALHQVNIIHRDIKCDNVLLDGNDVAKLGDFGASIVIGETMQKSTIGTFYWMAPEVLFTRGHSWQADVWSLGCTVMEMLTARRPFSWCCVMQCQLMDLLKDEKTPPPLPDSTQTEALDFIRSCLVKDKFSRPEASKLRQHQFFN